MLKREVYEVDVCNVRTLVPAAMGLLRGSLLPSRARACGRQQAAQPRTRALLTPHASLCVPEISVSRVDGGMCVGIPREDGVSVRSVTRQLTSFLLHNKTEEHA